MTHTTNASSLSDRRRIGFAAASIGLGLITAAFLAEWGLGIYFQRIQSQSMDPGLIRYHAQLGWSLSPNWTGHHTHHDYTATYTTSGAGFRSQLPAVANGAGEPMRRIAVFGDSFTFGLGVEDEETFVSLLNQTGDAEFVNHGVPGTSTDQQLLLMTQLLPRTTPDTVLMVVYLPNDLLDNTLEYPLQAEQAKPLFTLDNASLTLRNVPVPQVAKSARLREVTLSSLVLQGFEVKATPLAGTNLGRLWSTLLDSGSYEESELEPTLEQNLQPALSLFSALIDEVQTTTQQYQADFVVALLPGRDAMVNKQGISYHYQNHVRQTIVSSLESASVPVIDLMEMTIEDGDANPQRSYFPNDGHLTPAGHHWVAEALTMQLRR